MASTTNDFISGFVVDSMAGYVGHLVQHFADAFQGDLFVILRLKLVAHSYIV